MAHYRTSVRTPWSITAAFDEMRDLRKFSEWDPGIKAAELVAGTPGEPGSTYDLTVGGITDSVMRYELIATVAPYRIEAYSRTSLLESVDVISLTEDGDGCIVTYEADLTPLGFFRLGAPLLSLAFGRIGDRAAHGLEQHLDGEIVSLDDVVAAMK